LRARIAVRDRLFGLITNRADTGATTDRVGTTGHCIELGHDRTVVRQRDDAAIAAGVLSSDARSRIRHRGHGVVAESGRTQWHALRAIPLREQRLGLVLVGCCGRLTIFGEDLVAAFEAFAS
jgi:hypothetical protein